MELHLHAINHAIFALNLGNLAQNSSEASVLGYKWGYNQIMYSIPISIIPDELLMVGGLQQLPTAHPTPQSQVLDNGKGQPPPPIWAHQGSVSLSSQTD